MTVTFNVTITGGVETIAYLQKIRTQLETHVLIPAMRDWAEAGRNAMIQRMHYRSGRMRSMTKISKVGKYWSIIVDVPYAKRENERPGRKRGKKGGGQGTTHRYTEPALKSIQESQLANLMNRLNAFLS